MNSAIKWRAVARNKSSCWKQLCNDHVFKDFSPKDLVLCKDGG